MMPDSKRSFFRFLLLPIITLSAPLTAFADTMDCKVASGDGKPVIITFESTNNGKSSILTSVVQRAANGERAVLSGTLGRPAMAANYGWELLETKLDVEMTKFHSRTTYQPEPPANWLTVGTVFETDATTTRLKDAADSNGTASPSRHERFTVAGTDTVSVGGCAYPVVSIRLEASSKSKDKDVTSESTIAYSLDLHATLGFSAKTTIGGQTRETSLKAVSVSAN